MGPNLYDWSQWADAAGALTMYSVLTVILIGCALKLLPPRWDDWIDERWGRGSVRDWWLTPETERKSRRQAPQR